MVKHFVGQVVKIIAQDTSLFGKWGKVVAVGLKHVDVEFTPGRVYCIEADRLARTKARPSIAKVWRQASEAREEAPRPKPAPVQRQENLHALLAFIQGDPALRKALLQALGGAA